jgi:CRISPR system Cascade subunit CasC
VPNGTRTRFIVRALRDRLVAAGKPEQEATAVAIEFARAYSSKKGKMDKDPERTLVMLYLSLDEQAQIANALLRNWEAALADTYVSKRLAGKAKKTRTDSSVEDKTTSDLSMKTLADVLVKQHKERPGAPDIALFGRMLADRPGTNVDAACQVAHAISTHAVKMEYDFFTAVDELARSDETGAAMMDVAGFDSACFYRYERLDWDQLTRNLNNETDLARRTVEAFLRASEAAIPTGKKNSHDNYSRPVLMLAVARKRDSAGWSLVNAFEKPVRAWGGSGLVEPSVLALDRYWNDLCQFYGMQTVIAMAVALHASFRPDGLSEELRSAIKPNLDAWVQTILDALPQE